MRSTIFVSYARADFNEHPALKFSRMRQLLATIEYELTYYDKRAPYRFVRDERGLLNASYDIDSVIDTAIGDCDFGLVLMTERYSDSPECEKEFITLLEGRKPIFIVEGDNAWDTGFGKRISERFNNLDRILRASFWTEQDGVLELFGAMGFQQLKPEHREAYETAMRLVTDGLKTRHRELRQKRIQSGEVAAEEVAASDILLAEFTPDVRDEARLLRTALTDQGFTVLTFDPRDYVAPPGSPRSALEAATASCRLAIQLIGGMPGATIDDTPNRLVELQHTILSRSGKPFLVWQSPGFDPSEAGSEHQVFLSKLVPKPDVIGLGEDYTAPHRVGYDQFQHFALKEADALREAAERERHRADLQEKVGAGRNTRPPMVTIHADPSDQQVATALREVLSRSGNIYVERPEFDLDRKSLFKRFSLFDAVVMVYAGRVGRGLVDKLLTEIYKRFVRDAKVAHELAIGTDTAAELEDPPAGEGPHLHIIPFHSIKRRVEDEAALTAFLEALKNKTHVDAGTGDAVSTP